MKERWPDAELIEMPKVISGRHYRFERLWARRQVNDHADRGEIGLLSLVYRPLQADRSQVAVYLHGSTGGMRRDPAEPIAPQTSIVNYFVARGFTLVVPLRRGFGGSGGTYIAECSLWSDPDCTRDRYIELAGPALEDAIADTACVLDHVVAGDPRTRDAKVLLVGQSRGGFLAFAVAAAHPDRIHGVVSFAGGWLRVGASLTSEINARSRAFMADHLRDFAHRYWRDTLWIYGAGDSFYADDTTRAWFDAYSESGGRGRYLLIGEHPQPDGHRVVSLSSLWAPAVDEYLAGGGFAVEPIDG